MPKEKIVHKVGEKNQHRYGEKGDEFGIFFRFTHLIFITLVGVVRERPAMGQGFRTSRKTPLRCQAANPVLPAGPLYLWLPGIPFYALAR